MLAQIGYPLLGRLARIGYPLWMASLQVVPRVKTDLKLMSLTQIWLLVKSPQFSSNQADIQPILSKTWASHFGQVS